MFYCRYYYLDFIQYIQLIFRFRQFPHYVSQKKVKMGVGDGYVSVVQQNSYSLSYSQNDLIYVLEGKKHVVKRTKQDDPVPFMDRIRAQRFEQNPPSQKTCFLLQFSCI